MAPKEILWNAEKNDRLRRERNIGFEDIEAALLGDGLLADRPHPNRERFPSQRQMVVEVRGETYVVPYIMDDRAMFLKTIYPSRKERRTHGRRQKPTPQD